MGRGEDVIMEEYIIWTIGILFISVFVTIASMLIWVTVIASEFLGDVIYCIKKKIKEKMNDRISD